MSSHHCLQVWSCQIISHFLFNAAPYSQCQAKPFCLWKCFWKSASEMHLALRISQWLYLDIPANKIVTPFFLIDFALTWTNSPCLAFSLLVKFSPIKSITNRIGRICHREQIYFSSFLSKYSFRPLLVCSQFWSDLSGLAGLRWCKYHIQTTHCFLWKRGRGQAKLQWSVVKFPILVSFGHLYPS